MASTTIVKQVLWGRLGAHRIHALGRTNTGPARAAMLSRFETIHECSLCGRVEVDPDGTLAPDVRRRRAEHAISEHFTRMGMARAKKKAATVTSGDGLEVDRRARSTPTAGS